MAGLYDYTPGINAINQGLMNFTNVINQEKQRREQQNVQNIMNTKALFEMDRVKKQEDMLDKDIQFGAMLEARGASPVVRDKTIKYLQGLGYADEIGRVKARNMPTAIQTMNGDKQFQLDVHQTYADELDQQVSQLDQEIMKAREKNTEYTQDENYLKLVKQKAALQTKQLANKRMMGALTGAKERTVVPAGSTVLDENGQPLYTAPKEAKPVNMPPWFDALGTSMMGAKYNTAEGQAAVSDWVADPKNKEQLAIFQREYAANNAAPLFNVQQTSMGLQPVNVRTGQASGPAIGDKPLTNEMITSLQQIGTLKETLNAMKDVYNPKEGEKHNEWVGPIEGRKGTVKEKLGGMGENEALFRSRVAQLQNSLIYLMSGKQINESEYERLKKQIPEINLPNTVFEARMKEFDRTVDSIIDNRKKNMGGYGINQSSGNKTAEQEAADFLKKYMGGK
jgi:hypothetical protein